MPPLSDDAIREHILHTVLERIDQNQDRRQEALREFFAVACPVMDEAASERVAALVPSLLPDLYEKWIGMFVDRLFETVPRGQIEDLCAGDQESDATLQLVFIMFMESERMEKQVQEDLEAYGREHSADDALGQAVSSYVLAKLQQLGEEQKRRHQQ